MKHLLGAALLMSALVATGRAEAQCPYAHTVCEPVYFQDGTVMLVPSRQPTVMTDSRIAPAPTVDPFVRGRAVGVGARLGAGYGTVARAALWGPGLAIRVVATPSFALELGVDVLMQGDFGQGPAPRASGAPMVVPLSASTIWFWNTRDAVQPFVLVGFAAMVRREINTEDLRVGADFHAGTGVEVLVASALGISLEARCVLGFDDDGLTTAALLATTGLSWYIPI